MRRAHVIGAGLAGLSAAVRLAERGWKVTVSEAAAQAGGRCRSYLDPQIGLTIDNGNHLVLSGNHAVHDYLNTIDAADRLDGPEDARFPFMDLRDGRRWTLHPNAGPIPWWVFAKARRVPGTTVRDYPPLRRLIGSSPVAEVRDRMPVQGTVWDRLFEPFLVAALNTRADIGSAALAGAVVGETLAKGGRACRPRIATPSLAAAFVDPALGWLERHGATVRLGRRVRALGIEQGRVTSLTFAEGVEPVGPGTAVILALPSWGAAELLPDLTVPDRHHSIANAHFRVVPPAGADPIVGVIGGMAEWVFAFPDRISTTTSAADRLDKVDREELARIIWDEVSRVHRLKGPMPAWQVVREKRATFSATPEQDARRPATDATGLANLFLAGDWTKTGLPATIEGAIRSGVTAAKMAAHHVSA